MNSCLANNTNNNTEYITKSCATTLYPQLLYKSLSKYANKIQSSLKILAITTLSMSLFAAQSTSKLMSNLSKTLNLHSGEAAALANYVEVMGDSVDELQRSMDELTRSKGDSNFEFEMSNAKTWVSVVLTNDDTYMDGFGGMAMNGQVKSIVRRFVKKLAHLTSNGLALVNNYASSHDHHTLKEIPTKQSYVVYNDSFCCSSNDLIQIDLVLHGVLFLCSVYNVYKGVQARKGSMLVGFGNALPIFYALGGSCGMVKEMKYNKIKLNEYTIGVKEFKARWIGWAGVNFAAYVKANVMFAAMVNQHYQEGDVVWCHDYHLMFLPKCLKEHNSDMKVGWFLHTPFPSLEIHRTLLSRSKLLHVVLASDLVG
ncbi:Alpha,alpha-trehalose-phosphate synthase [UDP-forming] 1 [Camellia lanceoleosa]|uniref:Alpha,alpha-trehalose-phosphate synthase [UDP-forming] 1 n=1 Tax=Camellia lanceoleosa TaxID=1840588 RepID=A0ACC0G2E1_9ERIC|nr:Alpha,alpha-trehalose-phosphate synthase [UDP-forming] 1 [Camellia lanceoleosa]